MEIIKWRVPALITLAVSTVLTFCPIGKSAFGIEIAARQTSKTAITNVRVGTHADKTRVVLDVSRPTNFRYGVSADGTVVFIELSEVKWNASSFEPRHSRGKVLEFRYSPATHGGRFSILTDGPVSINKPFFVSPSGKRGHRIVIDLVRQRLTMPQFGHVLYPSRN